jgi:Fic family protein
MKIKEYKSGNWLKQYQFKSFMPSAINHEWSLDDDKLQYLLSKADQLIGQLDGFSNLVPNVEYFIQMHIVKEATESSRIEGTRTNMEEALQKIENIDPEKRNDWIEVNNYIKAMNYAIDELNRIPLCNRLLRKSHEILMQSVRGEQKAPGEFRTTQNWIGGSSIKNAVFVPPSPEKVPDLMSDLEKFLQNKELYVPNLIKIGIAHYQFETIHPFCDGNGRIGRLMITLFLVSERILCKPTLYLSDFFSRHRNSYYDNLTIAREKNNMTQWLYFFLDGVIETAERSVKTFNNILKLQKDIQENRIIKLGKKVEKGQEMLTFLFGKPTVDTEDVVNALKIHKTSALRLIYSFLKLGILKEATGYKRNRLFSFEEYMIAFSHEVQL